MIDVLTVGVHRAPTAEPMKCITIWQPWASLIMLGFKRRETRGWHTNHRGPLAIHAAAKPIREIAGIDDLIRLDVFRAMMHAGGYRRLEDLPTGALLGTCNMLGSVEVSEHNLPPYPERALGDFSIGRFQWFVTDQKPMDPIRMAGRQGLFDIDLPAIMAQRERSAAPRSDLLFAGAR